ncbi:hypothetical protein DEJ48_39230 [Streptomyces venezuelae]|uniref:Uncharacterized protein n=1 Tax=Streptomyces venezuelae TaxID=54571 RepID=A0A5P2CB69_STRVZ|nr:hypothetical protein DEJ48_39230 [Streptomyces venezuelae]
MARTGGEAGAGGRWRLWVRSWRRPVASTDQWRLTLSVPMFSALAMSAAFFLCPRDCCTVAAVR